MTERRSLSPMSRLRMFELANGLCHICGLRIKAAEKWDIEHVIPLALGGADNPPNMRPAHKYCHAPKTAEDVASIARAKRRKIKHIHGYESRNPMPGSKRSKWKKKMNGRTELR